MVISLKKNNEFKRVYKKGRYKIGRYIVMYVIPNKKAVNRIGITTGKRFGNSVQRNRMKRMIRETYRLQQANMKTGYDIIFMARATVRKADLPNRKLKAVYIPTYHEVEREIRNLSSALGMLA